jgi:hypothetical protein
MELINHDEFVEEILISDILKESSDLGKIINPNNKLDIKNLPMKEQRDDLTKEMIAYDSIEIGSRTAGSIHGSTKDTVNGYSNGESIKDPEIRARVLGAKHNIADKAVAQLMETLNLFDPSGIQKQSDIIKSAGILAGIVDKITGTSGSKGNEGGVHLHLYAPNQNKIEKYEIIDI